MALPPACCPLEQMSSGDPGTGLEALWHSWLIGVLRHAILAIRGTLDVPSVRSHQKIRLLIKEILVNSKRDLLLQGAPCHHLLLLLCERDAHGALGASEHSHKRILKLTAGWGKLLHCFVNAAVAEDDRRASHAALQELLPPAFSLVSRHLIGAFCLIDTLSLGQHAQAPRAIGDRWSRSGGAGDGDRAIANLL